MWCLARADVAPSQKNVNLVPCQSNDFLNCTVYSFMTSFPLRVCCHSAADLISCFFGAVWARLVIVVLKGRAAVNWDGEEALGLFVVSAAAHNGGLRILWIISRLCLHFFIQSFYVLAVRDTQGKILLDTLSLFFSTFAQNVQHRWSALAENQPWKTLAGFGDIFLTLRMMQKLIWNWRWINKRRSVEIPSDIWWAERANQSNLQSFVSSVPFIIIAFVCLRVAPSPPPFVSPLYRNPTAQHEIKTNCRKDAFEIFISTDKRENCHHTRWFISFINLCWFV